MTRTAAGGDPYSPPGRPQTIRKAPEVASEVDHFATRLRRLGATDAEVAEVVAAWDDLDPDGTPDADAVPAWTAAYRAGLVRAPDHQLVAMIRASRDEYAYATTTEDEAQLRAASRQAEEQAAMGVEQARAHVGKPVAGVLQYVGTDVRRATAVLALETGPDGANRKTLVDPLRQLVGQGQAHAGLGRQATGSPTAADTAPEGTTTPTEVPAPADGPQGPADGAPGAPASS